MVRCLPVHICGFFFLLILLVTPLFLSPLGGLFRSPSLLQHPHRMKCFWLEGDNYANCVCHIWSCLCGLRLLYCRVSALCVWCVCFPLPVQRGRKLPGRCVQTIKQWHPMRENSCRHMEEGCMQRRTGVELIETGKQAR